MSNGTKRMALAVLAGALSVLLLLAAAGLFVVYTRAYNMAATEDHLSFTRWAFDTTFQQSVGRRAAGLPAFGPSHDDRTLWGVAAFVRELPAMTPERYAALGASTLKEAAAGHGAPR